MKKPVAYYELDELFKEGDIIYDKEANCIFKYNKHKHRNLIKANPNNYRVAHKGDMLSIRKMG